MTRRIAGAAALLLAGALALAGKTVLRSEPAREAASDIGEACRQTADWLGRQLEDQAVLVRTPFVLGGDLGPDGLLAQYSDILAPAARALAAEHFATAPDEPITVLIFSDEASYRRHARRLFDEVPTTRLGYYRPQLRTIVVNAAAGPAPLRHELTHALMAFDFPAAPDWLAEGLASLYEDCRRDSSGRLLGETDWRLPLLQEAIRRRHLPPLGQLMAGETRAADERLWYAHTRYFCLFLQYRNRLGPFYRELRRGRSGSEALARLHPDASPAQIEGDFRAWVLQLR